jgi:CPA2 family monovalent cation:H+ antiporter-2
MSLLSELVIVFAISVGVLLICNRLRVPSIVGLLITGILVGPSALAVIPESASVQAIADIGIMLLLFTIGIEFSVGDIWQSRRQMLLGGALQVGATFTAVLAVALWCKLPFAEAALFAFMVSLSSTAIVVKLLQQRLELDSPAGRTTIAILLFQEIIVIPVVLVLSLQGAVVPGLNIWSKLGLAAVLLLAAFYFAPALLRRIATTRDRELFMLAIVAFCLSIAWMSAALGLSMAIGAFLAGVIIAGSEFGQQAKGIITPFRDLFTALFFVSMGMLLDVRFVLAHAVVIGLFVVALIIVKAVIAAAVGLLLRLPMRAALPVGTALAQIDEFSFVLASIGIGIGMITADTYQLFIALTIITMALTPFLMRIGPWLGRTLQRSKEPAGTQSCKVRHIIIVGFGVIGKHLAAAARMRKIPYEIIEMNPESVNAERQKGEPIFFGDATQETVLEHAGIAAAKVLVIAIPDPLAARLIVATARSMNPALHIIVRTPHIRELAPLRRLGADEVVPEEFETSVRVMASSLRQYNTPEPEIRAMMGKLRKGEELDKRT